MTKALSNDLRDRLIDAVDRGISCRAAAVRFGVAPSTAIKWLDRWRRTGERSSMLQGGDKRSHRIEAHAISFLTRLKVAKTSRWPRLWIGWKPNMISRWPTVRCGVSLSDVASHSKKTAHASEQQRPDVLARRRAWFDSQLELDPDRLVFIDETGASTKMARLYGRSKRGERCRAPIPHGHWKTTTFVGALRRTGMTAKFYTRSRVDPCS
jgi:hypothetical protein